MQLDTESGKNWYEASKNCMNFVLDEMSTCNLNIKNKANEEFKNLYEYLKPRENLYNVLSHGDLHLNNIMFSYENDFPKQCCFIDFQVLRFLPLLTDVLMLLHLNAPTELRKDSLSELLEYYFKQLTVELTKVGLDTSVIYPKNVFKTAINDSTVPVLLFNCMYKPFMVMDKKRLAECIKENSEDLMFGDRAKYIKREFDIDENYKKELFKEFQLLIDEIVKIV
ncbi:uncharacterized protein LOC123293563 [Chrysoperla carnea]|uniref:uncharacterized protein LOC123293563 n=1 Tax=Chrysoperla carnea TaxID=189513 RepID=UPI001D0884F0|nr:uncharacterized protein LOC123293563 [Chrysoperla carnea]